MHKPLFVEISAPALSNTHHGSSASRCPNCEASNHCVIAALSEDASTEEKAAKAKTCWCMNTQISAPTEKSNTTGQATNTAHSAAGKLRCFCKQCATVEPGKTS